MGIIDNGEQTHECRNLDTLEKAAAAAAQNGNIGIQKLTAEHLAGGRHGAHQDRNVAVSKRALHAPVGNERSRAHKRMYLLGDRLRFERSFVGRVVLAVGGHINEHKLRLRDGTVIVCAALELGIFIIIYLAQFCRHTGAEHMVCALDDLASGAEIFLKHYAHGLIFLRCIKVCVGQIFLGEYRGVGKAEAVDGLLDIADHEQVRPVLGHGTENCVLHTVDILILVDHYLRVALRKLPRKRRRLTRFICEKPGGEVLKVRKVDLGTALFLGGIGFVEIERQLQERTHGRCCLLHIRCKLFLGGAQHIGKLSRRFFAAVPQSLYVLGKLRVGRIAQGLELRKLYGQKLPCPVPAVGA